MSPDNSTDAVIDFTDPIFEHAENEFLIDTDDFASALRFTADTYPALFSEPILLQVAASLHCSSHQQRNKVLEPGIKTLVDAARKYDADLPDDVRRHVRPKETALLNWSSMYGLSVAESELLPSEQVKQILVSSMQSSGEITDVFTALPVAPIDELVTSFELMTAHARRSQNNSVSRYSAGVINNVFDFDMIFHLRDIDIHTHASEGLYGLSTEALSKTLVEYIVGKINLLRKISDVPASSKYQQELIDEFIAYYAYPYAHFVHEYRELNTVPKEHQNGETGSLGFGLPTQDLAIQQTDPYFSGPVPEANVGLNDDTVASSQPDSDTQSEFTSIDIE